MKHIHTIVLLLLMLLPLGSMADTLTIVNRFEKIEHASVLASYRNEFGSFIKPQLDVEFPYALIRVHIDGNEAAVTKAKERFALYLGQHHAPMAKVTNRVNEIMFLVPIGAGYVELQCGDGCQPLTLFNYPQLAADAIYEGKVRYALEIKKGWDEPDPIAKQYFKFRIHPSDVAGITVLVTENGQQEPWNVADGIASKKLDYGVYNYVISADRYHKTEGSFTVSDTNNELDIHLRPQFGWLNVSGDNSAQGAYVFATNHNTGDVKQIGTIPLQNTELNAGAYSLRIQKTKYKDYLTTISIKEGETTTIRPVLEANFAQLTLAVQSGAEIWLEGNRLGTTSWTGTLELGEYAIEARQANHRSSYTQVVVSEQSVGKTIQLNNPKPIYGTFEVSGSPADATVYVDGKKAGTTPLLVNKILIGSHKVRIEKDGYDKQEKTVTITEGQEAVMDYTLMKEVKPVLNNTSTTYNDKKNGQEKGVSLERIVLKSMNATNLSVKRAGDETLLFTYDLPKKGPVRFRMSTDGYTYTTQKNVHGAVGKEMDKGKQYQIAWTIPKDLGRTMKDSLYFQIVALPELPKGEIKIGSLYYEAIDGGTSVAVVRPPYKKGTYERLEYTFKKIAIPAEINYKGYKYSVTSIGHNAFEGCDNLTSVTIPNSVTSIGNWTFSDCDKLTSITIPNTVTSIGGSAFYATPWYKNYAKGRNVVYIGKVLYKHNNANLSSVVVREGTTSITSYAFSGCKSLQSISIPSSVRYIDDAALKECSSLAKITIDAGNPWLDSRDDCNAIIATKTNTLLVGCKNTVIPNSVTSIGSSAFEDCDNLTSITIPNSVTSIGVAAFKRCSLLTSITIPSSVTSIGFNAFYGCKNLSSITIPNSVTSIGSNAFYSCDNLSEIHLPTGMEAKFNKMDGIKDFYEQREKKYNDGYNYYYGRNGVKDYTKAVSYFRIAATQGHAAAQSYLGLCYDDGLGVDRNYVEAVKWYRKAAEQGDSNAQNHLGNCYYNGKGVDKNYTEAVKWYRKAAEQGHQYAQNNLGNCYYNGEGVDKNYTEAVKWYRKAAEQGYSNAQYNLGLCYQYGQGVTKNLTEAKKWYQKAADQRHEDAKERLSKL